MNNKMNKEIETTLKKLKKSNFRSKFKLSTKDIEYINSKGIEKIKSHTYDFINKRLAPETIINDGKQTPWKGHPTFIAQHATATCCRKCLYKWHRIPPNKELTKEEIDYIVNIIMAWINNQTQKEKTIN